MRFRVRFTLGFIAALTTISVVALGAALFWNSRDTTAYSAQFSEERFDLVKPGMELRQVYALLGQPLGFRLEDSPERWCYGEEGVRKRSKGFAVEYSLAPPNCVLFDEKKTVIRVTGNKLTSITMGMSARDVLRLIGVPDRRKPGSAMTLHYTVPSGEGLFRARIVAVDKDHHVSNVIKYEFYD